MIDVKQTVVRAYAGEQFGLPGAALTRLVRRRRRRRVYAAAAAVVFASGGLGIASQQTWGPAEPPLPGESGVTTEAAACYRRAGDGPAPVAAFTFVDTGEPGDRLVVAAGGQIAVACTDGETILFGPSDPRGPDWLDGTELDFAHGTSARHGLVVIGRTPPGTERVEVTLLDGTSVPVQVAGGWFAAWQPDAYWSGPGAGVRVVAHTATSSDVEELETGTG
jgi:hypothetical protein